MRISDWSSDVCSSDLKPGEATFLALAEHYHPLMETLAGLAVPIVSAVRGPVAGIGCSLALAADFCVASETAYFLQAFVNIGLVPDGGASRSAEHTSETQSLMRHSYAVFGLQQKTKTP